MGQRSEARVVELQGNPGSMRGPDVPPLRPRPLFSTTEMALALNRYLCLAVPLITKCAPLFAAGTGHQRHHGGLHASHGRPTACHAAARSPRHSATSSGADGALQVGRDPGGRGYKRAGPWGDITRSCACPQVHPPIHAAAPAAAPGVRRTHP